MSIFDDVAAVSAHGYVVTNMNGDLNGSFIHCNESGDTVQALPIKPDPVQKKISKSKYSKKIVSCCPWKQVNEIPEGAKSETYQKTKKI